MHLKPCLEDLHWCQAALQDAIYGVLPNSSGFYRDPLINEAFSTFAMRGLPSPGSGTGVGEVSWGVNMTALVWTIQERNISLNSTVFWTLSTKNRAAANYPPPPYASGEGPFQPNEVDNPWGPPLAPKAISDTLVMYHNGHETTSCMPNYDGVVDYLNEAGYDVMELMMPLLGCNPAPQYGSPTSHWWFMPFETEGYHTFKFFIEPVAQAARFAKQQGYKHVILLGLSGGGWTTTVATAVVPDIDMSIPVAGSVPKWRSPLLPDMWVPDLPEGRNPASFPPQSIFVPPPMEGAGGDYEQEQQRPVYSNSTTGTGIGYAELYLLATALGKRPQLQILHDFDSCCFRADGLYANISVYGEVVRNHSLMYHFTENSDVMNNRVPLFRTVVTEGNFHQVNVRDKVIVATVIERYRACAAASGAEGCWGKLFEALPFNLL